MTATFYVGDALEVMAKLPEKSVDLVLSSPPFLALRSYLPSDHPDKAKEGGSQATPGEYIDWLVDVAEACARVLAPHGSLCFELGDTYAGSGGAGGDYDLEGLREGQPKFRQIFSGGWPLPKSLSLIPELFRLTLVYGTNPLTGRTTERWRLRNVIRWVRPNPPVGALGDKFRPATSELMVFCKSAKRYFDLDAVREPYKFPDHPQIGKPYKGDKWRESATGGDYPNRTENPAGAPPLDWWEISLLDDEAKPYGPKGRQTVPEVGGPKEKQAKAERNGTSAAMADRTFHQRGGAPPLDWWNIPPGGYEGAHYAVFPPELCVRPIKAMSPEKVCRTCGEPRRSAAASQLWVGSASSSTNIATTAARRPTCGARTASHESGRRDDRSPSGPRPHRETLRLAPTAHVLTERLRMTYGDWRKPCEHGLYGKHQRKPFLGDPVCPGGSPVTDSDLEGLGEKEWWCRSGDEEVKNRIAQALFGKRFLQLDKGQQTVNEILAALIATDTDKP